jgi:hypothetical protein
LTSVTVSDDFGGELAEMLEVESETSVEATVSTDEVSPVVLGAEGGVLATASVAMGDVDESAIGSTGTMLGTSGSGATTDSATVDWIEAGDATAASFTGSSVIMMQATRCRENWASAHTDSEWVLQRSGWC